MKKIVLLALALMIGIIANAQTGISACPGLKNPTSFTSGSTSGTYVGYYSGQTGSKPSTAPNALTGTTGVNMTSSVYSASQLSSQQSSCSGTNPDPAKRFRIMSSTDGPGSGSQQGKDAHTNYSLPYCPVSYDNTINKSIRLGNECTGAEAEALYYTMNVRVQNALLFVYYGIVVEAPGHGVASDPSFVIRVCRQNAQGNWVQISDTLCYAVSSSGLTNNVNGWHSIGSGYNAIFYRDWNKVAINLNKYLYEQVRIEMYMGDCSASGHYGYCYIAGDCQPMEIKTSGCPAGATTNVQTLTAPTGMESYAWYKSTIDGQYINSLTNVPESVVFSPLSGTTNVYNCQVEDFRVTSGEGAGNLTNNMVFRCDMTSAMDPAKPFTSKVYVRVMNTKPISAIDTLKSCDGDITLTDKSYVPNDISGCDTSTSSWWFYPTSVESEGDVDSATGAVVTHRWDSCGTFAVKVRSYNTTDRECFTDKTYLVTTLCRPDPVLDIYPSRYICAGETVRLTDSTIGATRREWFLDNRTIQGSGENNRRLEWQFEQYKNPIELRVYNGLFTRDAVNTYDTIWCYSTAYDTVEVFQHPELTVTGDTVVCNGQNTDIHISTETPGCTYKWFRELNENNLIADGQDLRTMPYADTCKYYVRVRSQQGCIAWDSVYAYRVNPTLSINRHDMCAGDYVSLTADKAYSYSWTASPADSTLDEQLDETGHGPATITVSPKETTVYTLIGHGTNDCNANPLTEQITIHPIPVATVEMSPNFVDSDNPVVTLTDASPYSVRRVWFFEDGIATETTSPCNHDFGEVSSDSVEVTLVAYNDLDCSDTNKFRLPVTQFTFFAPNVFTPERPDNSTFQIYTANEQENFSVYIYDRMGRQVYFSNDLHFKWNGNTEDGLKCPQGAYVYVIRYRRPFTEDIVTQKGTITLLR